MLKYFFVLWPKIAKSLLTNTVDTLVLRCVAVPFRSCVCLLTILIREKQSNIPIPQLKERTLTESPTLKQNSSAETGNITFYAAISLTQHRSRGKVKRCIAKHERARPRNYRLWSRTLDVTGSGILQWRLS